MPKGAPRPNRSCEAEARVTEVSGRKTFTYGSLKAGDRLCAEAEGLFIAIDFEKMLELREARARRFES